MKRLCLPLLALLLLSGRFGVSGAREIPGGHYFGQTPPGFTPVVFAPGIISLPDRYEFSLTFSPNLEECVFGVTDMSWSVFNLWYTRMGEDSTWTDPVPAPFQGNGDAMGNSWAPDGNQIYFSSSRPSYPPVRLFRSTRQNGVWSDPVALDPPIFSGANEWQAYLTPDGGFYFSSDRPGGVGNTDIYRAVTAPGGGISVENLGAPINSPQLDGTMCVAPDGSYIVFESKRPGGYGLSDLYISFNQNGVWSEPRNLGPTINTGYFEDGPFLSPDGKYLFFNRRRSFVTTEQTEIWWVDARAVFHPEESGVNDPSRPSPGRAVLRNEPNPFSPSTRIIYSTPAGGVVNLRICDVLGRQVGSLVNEYRPAGTYSVDFAAAPGRRLSGGIYYCLLSVGGTPLQTGKMVALP